MSMRVINCVFHRFVPAPGKELKNVRELTAANTTSMVLKEGILHVESNEGSAVYPEAGIARLVVDPEPVVKKSSKSTRRK